MTDHRTLPGIEWVSSPGPLRVGDYVRRFASKDRIWLMDASDFDGGINVVEFEPYRVIPHVRPLEVPEPCEPETPEIWTFSDKRGHGAYGGRFGEEFAFWIDEDKPHRAFECLNRIVSGVEVFE